MKKILILFILVVALTNCTTVELIKSVATSVYKHSMKNKYAGHYKVGNPYKVLGEWYYPAVDTTYDKVGIASWYGDAFDAKLTANGEMFDKNALTAAHKTLPLPSMVRVTNLENNKSMLVRLNDRGPYVNDRIIDLSEEIARKLGVYQKGTAKVRVQFDEAATNKMFAHSSHKHFKRPDAHKGRKITKYKKYRKKVTDYNRLYVQIGAYNNHQSALKVAKSLKGKASAIVIHEFMVRGKPIYRVRTGPYRSEIKADKNLRNIINLGYKNAIIVTK